MASNKPKPAPPEKPEPNPEPNPDGYSLDAGVHPDGYSLDAGVHPDGYSLDTKHAPHSPEALKALNEEQARMQNENEQREKGN
jgi:hypothetical protein